MAVEEKEITLTVGGETKTFIIGKFPATVGREILLKKAMLSDTKMSAEANYALSSEISRKTLQYVKVPLSNGQEITLDSEALINNHVTNAMMLLKLETEIMDYNFGFLEDGEI